MPIRPLSAGMLPCNHPASTDEGLLTSASTSSTGRGHCNVMATAVVLTPGLTPKAARVRMLTSALPA